MADDPNQVEGEDVAVGNEPQEPTPSSDQKPTEEERKEESSVSQEDEALANSKNPERTKAYIESLKAKLKEYESKPQDYGTSVFDGQPEPSVPQTGARPQVPSAERYDFLNQQQVNQLFNQFVQVDPQTGEQTVDVNGLNLALFEANEQSKRAQQQVAVLSEKLQAQEEKIARFEESQQLKETYREFPELDPLNKEAFDPKFFELVRDRIVRNKVERKGTNLLDVARDIKSTIQPVDKAKVEEEAVLKVKKQQEAKSQGPLSQGRGVDRSSSYDKADVHRRIRQGDASALDEAMREAGLI